MLGMKTAEISRKLDEIVDFAQIGEFLDTPVKRYSSGMYVRLAFAVAAHLEPDILVVDEVLAVGDAAFQKKCLGKMNEVANRGRTILLVSHNLASVQSLCSRVLLLEAGEIRADGAPAAVIGQYLEGQQQRGALDLLARQDRVGDGSVRFKSVRIAGTDRGWRGTLHERAAHPARLHGVKPLRHARFVVSIYDHSETGIFVLDSDAAGGLSEDLPAEGTVECVTDPIDLTPGRCFVNLRLFRAGVQTDYVTRAAGFDVEAQDLEGSGKIPTRDWVLCLLRNTWSLEPAP
jgi:lipopolysaccharide transport system ATP-binding protein